MKIDLCQFVYSSNDFLPQPDKLSRKTKPFLPRKGYFRGETSTNRMSFRRDTKSRFSRQTK